METKAIQDAVTKSLGRGGLLVQKYSPEILMGLGVVGVIASTVLACKATLKVDAVMAETQATIDKVNAAHESPNLLNVYSEQDYKKDLALAYGQRGLKFAKLYGPSIALGVASIGCLLGSHVVLSKRNIAVVAAYKLIEESFSKYRERVTEEFGPEKERMIKYGITQETVTETVTDADGKKSKQKTVVESYDPTKISGYARFFDPMSSQWQKDATLNQFFLKSTQNWANDILKARGHLFLNEVYDMLGIPRSKEGAMVGWVMDNKRDTGDNYVDFGIYNAKNAAGRDFVNGYERSILLDFNVDGMIYDLI